LQRLGFGWDNDFDNTNQGIRAYMQRLRCSRVNRTIVPAFRAALAVVAAFMSIAAFGASASCVVPSFVVPIDDLDATVDRCKEALRTDPRHGVVDLRSLVMGWVCAGDYERSAPAADALECLARRGGAFPRESGPLLGRDDFDAAHCAVARQTLEWAARRGSGEAFFELYELGLDARGSHEQVGECAPDLATAAKYLEAAAALGVPRAKEELAVAIMAHLDKAADLAAFSPGSVAISQYLPDSSKRATRSDALALLESAAETGYPSTLAILSQALAAGYWGPGRDDEALAWAAIRAARYDDDSERAPFAAMYTSADAGARRRACDRIRTITRDDVNFRYSPGEISNPLMLQCVDPAAVVQDAGCVDARALRGIEQAIEPLVAQTPECADWAIATTKYTLEPPGAAAVETLEPLPDITSPD
jgi:hypothetical protein